MLQERFWGCESNKVSKAFGHEKYEQYEEENVDKENVDKENAKEDRVRFNLVEFEATQGVMKNLSCEFLDKKKIPHYKDKVISY